MICPPFHDDLYEVYDSTTRTKNAVIAMGCGLVRLCGGNTYAPHRRLSSMYKWRKGSEKSGTACSLRLWHGGTISDAGHSSTRPWLVD